MTSIEKFSADIERTKKFDRANNGGKYSGTRACTAIADLFNRNNRHMGDLAGDFSGYWYDTYVTSSSDPENEPSDSTTAKIVAMQALLDGNMEEADTESLSQEDWKELCSLTNLSAEDIPLDTLNDMMMIFVDHQAL